MNDNDTVAVNKTALIKFMEAFVEHGYGKTQEMSVPDEWSEIIDIACNVRSSSMKEQTMNDNAVNINMPKNFWNELAIFVQENPPTVTDIYTRDKIVTVDMDLLIKGFKELLRLKGGE